MLVGYARPFVHDEDRQVQLDALAAAGCTRIVEETVSGGQRGRPQLLAALDDMRRGDTLVVWRLDRLAPSLRQLIETVETMDARGVALRSLIEAIDTTGPGGAVVFRLFAALAAFDRAVVRERTIAGLAAARERGKAGGRPPAMTEADVAAAKALLSDPDITAREVARRLGVSVSTLYKHIPAARGTVMRRQSQ